MILIINICKEPLHYHEFVRPVEDILRKNNIKFVTKHYKHLSQKDILAADKAIICGTSLKDNDFIDDINQFSWLKNFKKPALGICGGAHIIGLLLGYKQKKNEQVGLKKVSIKNFLGINKETEVYHLHQFQYLPEIFHKDNFYATLFHPEVRNKEIIENFLKL